jgi:hypothetical protein
MHCSGSVILCFSRNKFLVLNVLITWMAGIQFMAGARDFSLLHRIQTGLGAHPASYYCVPGVVSPGVKWLGREADHSPLSSIKVKHGGAIPLLPMSSRHGS